MTPNEFVERFKKEKASAILRTSDTDRARQAMLAAVRGGFRVVEFTMSIPNVTELIDEFSRMEGTVVGAGTVLTTDDVKSVVDAGAQFVVSPVVDVDVIKASIDCEVACMPGCTTPTEMLTAYRAGAQLQKLFPQVGTGPQWVKQCLGPLPFLKIVPTSGVTLENARSYFEAGAYAVGFVQSLFLPDDIASDNFDATEIRAKKILAEVQS